MQIFVKTFNGKTVTLQVNDNDLVENVKQMYGDREGVPIHLQRLICGNKILENGNTLNDYHVTNDAIVYVLVRLPGG